MLRHTYIACLVLFVAARRRSGFKNGCSISLINKSISNESRSGSFDVFRKVRPTRRHGKQQITAQNSALYSTIVANAFQLAALRNQPLPESGTTPIIAAGSVISAVTLTAALLFRQ